MIYYVCHRKHPYTLGIFLEWFTHDFKSRIRLISYDDLWHIKRLRAGIIIFTDFDRISDEEISLANEVAQYLEKQDGNFLILNHPARALGRYALLSKIHEKFPSAPAVTKLSEWKQVRAFPVFIRGARDHHAALSDLIETPTALEVIAKQLLANHPDPDDLIVIQFKNAPGSNGLFRKYGAFRVGDVIYGQHLFQNTHWWVKDNGADWSMGRGADSRDYVQKNPHADQLMPYFELAGIEYGRIDYGIFEDEIVVFEINTNPVVNANPPKQKGRFNPQDYADLHNAALAKLPVIDGPLHELPAINAGHLKTMTAERAHRRMVAKVRKRIFNRRLNSALRQLRSRFLRKSVTG